MKKVVQTVQRKVAQTKRDWRLADEALEKVMRDAGQERGKKGGKK